LFTFKTYQQYIDFVLLFINIHYNKSKPESINNIKIIIQFVKIMDVINKLNYNIRNNLSLASKIIDLIKMPNRISNFELKNKNIYAIINIVQKLLLK